MLALFCNAKCTVVLLSRSADGMLCVSKVWAYSSLCISEIDSPRLNRCVRRWQGVSVDLPVQEYGSSLLGAEIIFPVLVVND